MGSLSRLLSLLVCLVTGLSATVFQTTLATGLPTSGGLTGLAAAPDGRVFVLQRTGQVQLFESGMLSPVVHLNTIASFTSLAGEHGLLGVALDPDFGSNGYVYLHYNTSLPGGLVSNRISRFTLVGSTINTATEQILIDLEASGNNGHVGGGMVFGADGQLYVGVGDRRVPASAATATDTWGSVLRLNPNGTFAGGDVIPLTGNPFNTGQGNKGSAVYVQGLRNPFGIAVQPGTGLMFINDAGEQNWEEINAVAFGNPIGAPAGANFGWPGCEGNFSAANPTVDPCPTQPGTTTAPLYAYSSIGGPNPTGDCAITGGTFYLNTYLFSDFCSGKIRMLDLTTQTVNALPFYTLPGFGPTALATSHDGNTVYYLDSRFGTFGQLSQLAPVPEPATLCTVALVLGFLLLRQPRFQLRPARVKRLYAGLRRGQLSQHEL